MTFESNFKNPIAGRIVRARAAAKRKGKEDGEKRKVRGRDRYCRMPLCGCRKFRLALHVSHSRHKGMGGNPAGDRSLAALMLLVCSARHKENRIAIDRGTLRWRALTRAGANGPVAWDVDRDAMRVIADGRADDWIELA